MKHQAFTLVEVAVAVAAIVLLSAVALPRLGVLLQKQDFIHEAQKIMNCIQDAQIRASAPNRADYQSGNSDTTGYARWLSADISTDQLNGKTVTTCKVLGFSSEYDILNQADLGNVGPSASLTLLTNTPTYTTETPMVIGRQRLYFGVSEGGSLQALRGSGVEQEDGDTNTQSGASSSRLSSPFSLAAAYVDPYRSSSSGISATLEIGLLGNSDVAVIINIPFGGSPITMKNK